MKLLNHIHQYMRLTLTHTRNLFKSRLSVLLAFFPFGNSSQKFTETCQTTATHFIFHSLYVYVCVLPFTAFLICLYGNKNMTRFSVYFELMRRKSLTFGESFFFFSLLDDLLKLFTLILKQNQLCTLLECTLRANTCKAAATCVCVDFHVRNNNNKKKKRYAIRCAIFILSISSLRADNELKSTLIIN